MNRNIIQNEAIDTTGKEKEITKESKKGKEFSTPQKLNSFLEFQSVVSATSTSTSNINPTENEAQKLKTKEKKNKSGLEISFHIKEAWNIFEVSNRNMIL